MSYVDIPNSKEAIRYLSKLVNNKWNLKYKNTFSPWLNDEHITHKRGEKYSPIGGVEIETCVNYYDLLEVNDNIESLNDFNEYILEYKSFYEATEDGSIRCDTSSDWGIELVCADPKDICDMIDAPEKVVYDYMTKKGDIGKITIGSDTKYFLTVFPQECVLKSCGTHIHMSIPAMTKDEYPQFNVIMRYFWIQFYQPLFISEFDKGEARWKNHYSQFSTEVPRGKYEMFNGYPSKWSNYWHFEFRALGSVEKDWGFFCDYVSQLLNMWSMAKAFYDNMPKTTKKIEIYEEKLENMNIQQLMQMFFVRRRFDDFARMEGYLAVNEDRITIDTLYKQTDKTSQKEILIKCIEQYDKVAAEKDFGNHTWKYFDADDDVMKLPRYSIRQTQIDFNPDDYDWGWGGEEDIEIDSSPDEASDSDYDDYSFNLKF
jgi:hypothetical protein